MMTLSDEQIIVLRPDNNHVLCRERERPVDANNRNLVRLRSGLYIDTSYNPGEHQNVIYDVITPPLGLIYDNDVFEKRYDASMEWKTDMVVKPDDIVWVNWSAAHSAVSFMGADGYRYSFIPYPAIYMIHRGDEIIMPNGYMAVLMADEVEEFGEYANRKQSKNFGVIMYLGEPNYEYQDVWVGNKTGGRDRTKFFVDDDYVSVGNLVYVRGQGYPTIEYSYHSELEGGDKMIAVQRKDIMYIVRRVGVLKKKLEYAKGRI